MIDAINFILQHHNALAILGWSKTLIQHEHFVHVHRITAGIT